MVLLLRVRLITRHLSLLRMISGAGPNLHADAARSEDDVLLVCLRRIRMAAGFVAIVLIRIRAPLQLLTRTWDELGIPFLQHKIL